MIAAANRNTFLIREPADEYHAQSRDYLSSHQLAEFRRCPELYHRRKLGLITDVDRPAYLLGRAAHVLILEGLDAFDAAFAVGGPVNPKTGQPFGANTKTWAEWADAQGKDVLSTDQFDVISRMTQAVQMHPLATTLLAEGTAEGVVRTDYCKMPCQIRLDWFDPHRGIVDLKTCDDLTWFEADARRFQYIHQMAFYRTVLAQVLGVHMPVHIVAVEKKEPFRCGVWKIDPDTLAIARQDNEAAIDRLRQCLASDHWPTGYEELRVFDQL
jgi:hypothetical protein